MAACPGRPIGASRPSRGACLPRKKIAHTPAGLLFLGFDRLVLMPRHHTPLCRRRGRGPRARRGIAALRLAMAVPPAPTAFEVEQVRCSVRRGPACPACTECPPPLHAVARREQRLDRSGARAAQLWQATRFAAVPAAAAAKSVRVRPELILKHARERMTPIKSDHYAVPPLSLARSGSTWLHTPTRTRLWSPSNSLAGPSRTPSRRLSRMRRRADSRSRRRARLRM